MPTLTIKNIPLELYKCLKERAAENRRSLNGEVIVCLERAVGYERLDAETYLARVRAFRRTLPNVFLTDEEITATKNEGRP